MRTIIFGAAAEGVEYLLNKGSGKTVVAFADNDLNKQGKEILGIKIVSADDLCHLQFDKVYIASTIHYQAIKKQLEGLGITEEKYDIEMPVQKSIDTYLNKASLLYQYRQYEKKWQILKKQYLKINVYILRVEAIGELISRYLGIYDEAKKGQTDRELDIFIPITLTINRVCNFELLKIMKRYINIIDQEEVGFWRYILKEYGNELNISELDKYMSRHTIKPCDIGHAILTFSEEEMEKGRFQLKKMGLQAPYVCFLTRTAAYNQKTIGTDYNYAFRNANFLGYQKAINYLNTIGISAVRMGREEEPLPELKNCIDYAGYYANDLMDLFLIGNCKFFVAAASGLSLVAGLFHRPVIIVNNVFITYGWGGTIYTEDDLYIPKKYYDRNKSRFLSLQEIIEVEAKCLIDGNKYHEVGIEFVDNTPEEICEVVQEMIARLEGTWIDTEADRKNHKRYLEIYKKMEEVSRNNEKNWIGGPMPIRLATSYLRNNLYLLESN